MNQDALQKKHIDQSSVPYKLLWLSVNCSYSHSSLALPLLHQACANINSWQWVSLETTLEEDPAWTA